MTQSEDLFDWWAVTARKDAEMVVPKSVEYGSNSLEQVGRKMSQLQGREVTKAEALELGCWSYAIGKMERWTDAVMRGETPSVDTLVDLGVYTTMARRIREVGDWPGRNVGSTCYHGYTDCERCDHHAPPWTEIGFTIDQSALVDEPDARAVVLEEMRKPPWPDYHKTTPQGLTLNAGDEVRRHVDSRAVPETAIIKQVSGHEDGSVLVGWPDGEAWEWSDTLWLFRRADQINPHEVKVVATIDGKTTQVGTVDPLEVAFRNDTDCPHKNVNVHTIQPGTDKDRVGVGTCLDCKREVPVKKPFGYTPNPNGAHE